MKNIGGHLIVFLLSAVTFVGAYDLIGLIFDRSDHRFTLKDGLIIPLTACIIFNVLLLVSKRTGKKK